MTIKEIVASTGLSQRAFAERFHVPLRTLEDWLAGKRNPPEYVIWMMQQLLDK